MTIKGTLYLLDSEGKLHVTYGLYNAIVPNANIGSGIDATKISSGVISNTEFDYLNGVDRLLYKELQAIRAVGGTRLRSGGVLSRVSNTTFSISDGSGVFVDNYTDPLNPVVTEVSWSGLTNITATQIANTTFTLITIDKNLTIHQRLATEQYDYYNYRDEIILGTLQHFDKTAISGATRRTFYDPIDSAMALGEYQRELGGVIRGNAVSGVAASLTIQKASGTLWNIGANYFVNKKDPNRIQLSALNPITFQYLWRDGAGGWKTYAAQTLLQPGYYDNNTVGSPSTRPNGTVPNNSWTIQRAKLAGDNVVVLHFGQTVYSSLAFAIDGISTEEFVEDPDFSNYTSYFYILMKGNCTDTSDNNQCEIIMSSNVRSGGGGSTAAVTNLQQSYNNSSEPEIIVTAAKGAINIADAATPIGASLFQVQNSGNTEQFLTVDASKGIRSTIGLSISEGSNRSMGVATLVAGTVTVSNTRITASTRVFLTAQNSSGTAGNLYIASRVNGASFTITSTSGTDTRTIAWLLIEP